MHIEKCIELYVYSSMDFHNKYISVTIIWVKKWDITGTPEASLSCHY